MHHADADVRLADVDVPDLLIYQLLLNRFLRVGLQLTERDVGSRAHVACRLRVGGVDLRLGDERSDGAERARNSDQDSCHRGLTGRLKAAPTYAARGRLDQPSPPGRRL